MHLLGNLIQLNVLYLFTEFFIFPFVYGKFESVVLDVSKCYKFSRVDGEVMYVFHAVCWNAMKLFELSRFPSVHNRITLAIDFVCCNQEMITVNCKIFHVFAAK